VTANYKAPGAFYRVEERGEMVTWMRNGQQRVELFNASILGRKRGRGSV
jgi:hypothetical protein